MTHTPVARAPAEAVFHGPVGEFVLRTEPHTESVLVHDAKLPGTNCTPELPD